MEALREACAQVAERARSVTVVTGALPGYAARLPLGRPAPADPAARPGDSPEERAAYWLTLDAINFGSGWFPTLRKPSGRSGYQTISEALSEHFARHGPWSADRLGALTPLVLAETLHQDPEHELMALFAASLNDLGWRLRTQHSGSFTAVLQSAAGSAVALAEHLGRWPCFADCSPYEDLQLPFLKRAQIAAADLVRSGAADFGDLDRLTMFADNLVPHVLRLDGVLEFDPELASRIAHGELIAHGSPEEVEIRACAVHAVELIVAERRDTRAVDVDQLLWERGQQARYKASPRHRSRCTAY